MNAVRGPHRLILIRSGVYDYAEVEIDRPLHLVAANNVGKTTLIAALQFLYIDDQRQMYFSHDWSATKSHYFPHTNSFVLFECMTDLGWRVVGARGLGPSQAFQFERFVYQGRFQRDHYFDGRRFRSGRKVIDNLAGFEYRTLASGDLRKALMGTLDDSPLGLVPLRQSTNYQSFRVLFRNLLRLSHLSANDLKDLLINIHTHLLAHREINLQDSHDQYQRATLKAHALRELQRAQGAIREVIDLSNLRQQERGELVYLWDEIQTRFNEKSAELAQKLSQRQERVDELGHALDEANQQLKTTRNELGKIQRHHGGVEIKLDELNKLRRRFADFDLNDCRTGIKESQRRYEGIIGRLQSLSDAEPTRVARRIASLKQILAENRRTLANLKDLAITRLRAHPDLSDGELRDAFRVLNPKWLKLPLDSEDVQIIEPNRLIDKIRHIASRVDHEGYQDDLLRIGQSELPAAPDIAEAFEPAKLEAQINDNASELESLEQLQKDLEKRKALEDEKSTLEDRLNELRQKAHEWQDWQKREEERPELESKLAAFTEQKATLKRDIAKRVASHQQLENQRRSEQQKHADDVRLKQDLHSSFTALPRLAFEAQPVAPANDQCFELPLHQLFEKYTERFTTEKNQTRQLEQLLTQIERYTGSRFVGTTDSETLRNLSQALESLEEQQRAIDELWRSLITGLRSQLGGLLKDLKELRGQVRRLNKALAKRQISNLKRLELVIRDDEVLVGRIEDILAYDDQPLFADARKADEATKTLARLLEDHPRLELHQLFTLQFRITKDSGETKNFDPREQIESTGTTVTSKVLVHLELLHRMLREGEANIPFFLDEVSMLDSSNLSEIIEHARNLNFVPVVASPEPTSYCVDALYFLRSSGGNIRLEPSNSRIQLDHKGRDNREEQLPDQVLTSEVISDE